MGDNTARPGTNVQQKAAANKEVVSRFLDDVFVQHDLTRLDEYMRDDYIQHNPDCPQGKDGFLEFFGVIFGALPDFRYSVKKVVADGDIVMAWCTTSGTHAGSDFLGQPASGNRVRFDVVDIFRMEEGLIAEHWDVADTFTFFSQLGVVRGAENRQRVDRKE
jgi:predicted SnoaL-like aldol condensation-catalyzing enzyme